MAGDRGLVRGGFELAEGVPGHDFYSIPFESESFAAEPTYEPNPNLNPTGNETQGEILRMDGSGQLVCAANSESLLFVRIHHHGFAAKTSPAAGVHLWELRDIEEGVDAPLAFNVDSLHYGVWRDEETNPSEYRVLGAKVTEFNARTDANSYVFMDHDHVFLRDRIVKKPDEIAVNAAYAGTVEVRGHRAGGDEYGDYYKFRVVTAGALDGSLPLPTIQWGKGAAAYPGVGIATYPVVPNEWLDAHNPDGTIAGLAESPLQIRFIADPATDVLTAADEWRILATAPKPVPAFSARPNLLSTRCEVRFSRNGGVTWFTKVIEGGFTLKMGRPREVKFGLGSVFGQRIGRPDDARKWWELGFNTTYQDRDLVNAMRSGVAFQAYARFDGAFIGATGLKDFAEYTLEKLRVTQAGSNISTAGDLPESPVLRAFSSEGSPLCIERYQNTIASVTPT